MLLETLLATFAHIVHDADLWRGNLPCIIRMILESFLIQGIILESFLIQESALNHPNHFGIIFDSGLDPRSKIPGRSSQGILDPVLARIIRIILE